MPDYKSSDIVGYKWRRCKQIIIRNLRDQTPSASFLEEDCVMLVDEIISKEGAELKEIFTPELISTEFKVLDFDGNDTGSTMNYGQLYCILKSAYMYAAGKRDDAVAAQVAAAEAAATPTEPPVEPPVEPSSSSDSSSG